MEKIRGRIWKSSRSMALDAAGMAGGSAILWKPKIVEIIDCKATHFVLIVDFNLLNLGNKGSLMNIYGPSSFPQKQSFLDFLGWVKGITENGNWLIGGHFNLNSNLGEKKGGR